MATLNASPSSPQPLDGNLVWEIGKGSGGDIARIGYKFMQGSNEIIGLSASDLDVFKGNFARNCRGLVSTAIPQAAPGIGNDNEFQKKFKLTYGDIIIEDCESTVTVDSDSAEVDVFNGYDWNGSNLLTNRPFRFDVGPKTEDWVWLLGSGNAMYTWELRDGTTGGTTISAPFDVNVVPLTPAAMDLSLDVKEMTVLINQGGDSWTFEIIVRNCYEIDLTFLEPMGSYATIAFEDYDVQTWGENTVIELSSLTKVTTARGFGGQSRELIRPREVLGVDGGLEFTFRRKVGKGWDRFLMGLAKQRGAFIKHMGHRFWFEVDPSGVSVGRSNDIIDLEITGRI